MKVKIPKPLDCKRCQHLWIPKKVDVVICPKCKSPYWFRERKRDGKRTK